MASFAFVSSMIFRRLSLAAIDVVVSARLGPSRIQGNAQPACFKTFVIVSRRENTRTLSAEGGKPTTS